MTNNISTKNIYTLLGVSVLVVIAAVVLSGLYFLQKSLNTPSSDEISKPKTEYYIGGENIEPTIHDYEEIEETNSKLNYLLIKATSNKPISNIEAFRALSEIREELKNNNNGSFEIKRRWLNVDSQLEVLAEELMAGTIGVYDAAQQAQKVFEREVVS